MANYREMYLALFRETTKAIHILQRAQQEAEETYTAEDSKNILTIVSSEDNNTDK